MLGSGGMGVVVAAFHVQLQERVALKFLRSGVPHDDETRRRFLREARAAVRIRNDHVVRVMDVGVLDDGAPYLVMEYLDGRDLAAELTQRGRIPLPDAVDWVLQACEAIAEAHALGIVHRDLKPANLFLTQRANGALWLKVMDFGISKVPAGLHEPAMTRTQAVSGSPAYMSPEQLRSLRDVDARTDLWALGAVLFQLVSGETPFTGETLSDLCIKIATEKPRRLTELCPDVPRAFEAVIERCLDKNREQRYANVAELALALAPFGTKRGQTSVEHIVGVVESNLAAVPRDSVPAATESQKPTDPETLRSWGRNSPTSPTRVTSDPPSTFRGMLRAGRRRWLIIAALAAASMVGLAVAYVFTTNPSHDPTSNGRATEARPPQSAVVLGPSSSNTTPSTSSGAAALASGTPLPSATAQPPPAPAQDNPGTRASRPPTRVIKPRSDKPPSSTSGTRPSPAPAPKPSATGSVFDSRRL